VDWEVFTGNQVWARWGISVGLECTVAPYLNIILFHPAEVEHPLSRTDARAAHLLDVLRLKPGESFDAGIVDGLIGRGTLVTMRSDSLVLSFVWGGTSSLLYPIHLLIGLPRPQTSRDILREMTALGVASMHFVYSEKGEPSYRSSTLWTSDEWMKCVINGAAQAFCTRLPKITRGGSLAEAMKATQGNAHRLALDNYEGCVSLTNADLGSAGPVVLAVGSERGWSPGERQLLRDASFNLVHLGSRVLRTETACIAAVTLIASKLGLF
jgi:16S rRNA (uracil1498-N3)-methyltransferase